MRKAFWDRFPSVPLKYYHVVVLSRSFSEFDFYKCAVASISV